YITHNTNYNNDDFNMVKALLVEDNPLNMELIIEILKSQGFTVDTAGDGEKAVIMAGNSTYDLVLMDIALPGIDGIETAKKIKSRPQYKNVPFVALTAFAMAGDKERLLNAGFNEYVSKPLDVHDFVKKMEKYRK
ncbi:MAG: response regulator, partial [Methanosarcinales archaeon]